jgi:NADP-dependent 3-hydroxy acid dehydrogenase YdfG
MRQAAFRLASQLPGKRAVVTGAASGLGLAFTTRLSAGGWTLGLMDRDAQGLATVRNSLNTIDNTIHTYHVNVADAQGVAAAIERFVQAERGLDLMINNAGVAAGGEFLATPLDDWRWIVDINLMGVVHGCRAALPHMCAANLGCIINIASAAGFACGPAMSAYNVTKAGVIALSETLMQELIGSDVRVSVAMPGFFPTRLLDEARVAANVASAARTLMRSSKVTADDVAESILAAVARGRTHIVLPRRYRTLWLWKRWWPAHFVRTFPRVSGRALRR